MMDQIIRALRARHPEDRWVFATQVETTTGVRWGLHDPAEKIRRIDAFAMALWPSLYYKRVAYEIKLTRADWLKELNDPAKRSVAFLLSDEFWFVLDGDAWRPEDRRPDLGSCGILLWVAKTGKLHMQQKPQRSTMAWPMPIDFMASFLRRVRGKTWTDIYEGETSES